MRSEAWPAHIGIGTSPLLLQTAPRAGRGPKGVAAKDGKVTRCRAVIVRLWSTMSTVSSTREGITLNQKGVTGQGDLTVKRKGELDTGRGPTGNPRRSRRHRPSA